MTAVGMPKTKQRKRRPETNANSPRQDMLRVLMLGGARGGYGWGHYPEGVFASPRDMWILWAVAS